MKRAEWQELRVGPHQFTLTVGDGSVQLGKVVLDDTGENHFDILDYAGDVPLGWEHIKTATPLAPKRVRKKRPKKERAPYKYELAQPAILEFLDTPRCLTWGSRAWLKADSDMGSIHHGIKYHCSRSVVGQALKVLVAEGKVELVKSYEPRYSTAIGVKKIKEEEARRIENRAQWEFLRLRLYRVIDASFGISVPPKEETLRIYDFDLAERLVCILEKEAADG